MESHALVSAAIAVGHDVFGRAGRDGLVDLGNLLVVVREVGAKGNGGVVHHVALRVGEEAVARLVARKRLNLALHHGEVHAHAHDAHERAIDHDGPDVGDHARQAIVGREGLDPDVLALHQLLCVPT